MSSRWRRVKDSKANLVLFVVGIFLIVLSGFWRYTIAPAIRVVPTDIDLVRFYDGHLSTYLTPPGQPPVNPSPKTYNVTIQAKENNPVRRSTTGVAVIELQTSVINSADNQRLATDDSLFAVNRRSAQQVGDHGANKDRSGYYLVFPFDTPKANIPIWDPLTGKTQNGVYLGQRKVGGVNTYRFKVSYAGQPAVAPPGFPTEMTGAQLKSMLGDPALGVGDGDAIKVEYKANQNINYLIEPIAGNLVVTRDAVDSIYLSASDPARSFSVTQVVSKFDYKELASSQQEAATFASDEIKKISLQFLYLPAGYLLLGIFCTLVGFFTAEKSYTRSV